MLPGSKAISTFGIRDGRGSPDRRRFRMIDKLQDVLYKETCPSCKQPWGHLLNDLEKLAHMMKCLFDRGAENKEAK